MSFNVAVERVLGHEGGYAWHPNDPGGETNWGNPMVSQALIEIRDLLAAQERHAVAIIDPGCANAIPIGR